MPFSAKAITFTGVNTVGMADVELPDLEPDEVLIEAELTGVSPGTEMRVLSGKQDGFKGFPVIPGYTFVGRVMKAGAACTVVEGTRVYCSGTKKVLGIARTWGGYISHALTREAEIFALPDSLPSEKAVLTTLAAISYHGMVMTDAKPHETVLVVGLGPIGQFSARLFSTTGARVICADIADNRVDSVRKVGLEAVNSRDGLNDAVRSLAPEGADIVVDATGFAPVMADAMQALRDLPWDHNLHVQRRFVVQGSYAGDINLPYRGAFQREAKIFLPRNHIRRDIHAVIDLMNRGVLNVEGLLSRIAEPGDAQSVYTALVNRTEDLITAAFRWQ